MLRWIGENGETLNFLVNAAMLLVWVSYLQLFLMSYVRQRRSSILINRGAGTGIEARCLICNMSAEPVYVQSIFAQLRSDSKRWTAPVTDFEGVRGDQVDNVQKATNQGPLASGQFIDVGTFAELAARAARHSELPSDDIGRHFDSMELTVIAAHSSDDLSVAARHEFKLGDDGSLTPTTVGSEQIRSWFRRKQLGRYLGKYL